MLNSIRRKRDERRAKKDLDQLPVRGVDDPRVIQEFEQELEWLADRKQEEATTATQSHPLFGPASTIRRPIRFAGGRHDLLRARSQLSLQPKRDGIAAVAAAAAFATRRTESEEAPFGDGQSLRRQSDSQAGQDQQHYFFGPGSGHQPVELPVPEQSRYLPPVPPKEKVTIAEVTEVKPSSGLEPRLHRMSASPVESDHGSSDSEVPSDDEHTEHADGGHDVDSAGWETESDNIYDNDEDIALSHAARSPEANFMSDEEPPPEFRYRVNPAMLDLFSDFPNPSPPPEDEPGPTGRIGYAGTSAAILAGFDFDEPVDPVTIMVGEGDNDIVALRVDTIEDDLRPVIEELERERERELLAVKRPGSRISELEFEHDFGVGYQQREGESEPSLVHQRVHASHPSDTADCVICADTKPSEEFPILSVTSSCSHPPQTCLDCVQTSIMTDLNSKLWTEIRCPECRELLEYIDIQRYADSDTFARYEALALRAAAAEAEDFIWCVADCGSGQVHSSGDEQPIVTCLKCESRFCFHHKVAWHETLTCEEYDRLLADPDNFRSRIEIENEEMARQAEAQLEADRSMAQGLLAEQEEETRRREARAKEERERAQKAMQLQRQIAARQKKEEQQSLRTIGQVAKPCPGCRAPIQKNEGCSHMTCSQCQFQFCFECGADHKDILKRDNSAHKETCRFHPSQMRDPDPAEVY